MQRPYLTGMLAILLISPSLASAASINLIVTNVDLAFDGVTGELTEAGAVPFGASSPADSQLVTSAELEVDGVSEALLVSPAPSVHFDLRIPNLGPSLALNAGALEGQGGPAEQFALDLFTDDGHSLQLAIGTIDYVAIDTPFAGTDTFAFFAEASVLNQNLPGGIAFPERVQISYSASNAEFTPGGPGAAIGLSASGGLTISGASPVPEPGSMCLTGLLLAAGVAATLRHRWG